MNWNMTHVYFLFAFVFFAFILELILLGFWNKTFCSVGVPIFFKKFAFVDSGKVLAKTEGLVNSFGDEKGFKDLTGKKAEDNLFFFRIRMDRKGSGFFHGSIRLDFENRILSLKCFIGFSELVFYLGFVFMYLVFFREMGVAVIFLCMIFVSNIGVDLWKCRKIAKKIEELLCEAEKSTHPAAN